MLWFVDHVCFFESGLDIFLEIRERERASMTRMWSTDLADEHVGYFWFFDPRKVLLWAVRSRMTHVGMESYWHCTEWRLNHVLAFYRFLATSCFFNARTISLFRELGTPTPLGTSKHKRTGNDKKNTVVHWRRHLLRSCPGAGLRIHLRRTKQGTTALTDVFRTLHRQRQGVTFCLEYASIEGYY